MIDGDVACYNLRAYWSISGSLFGQLNLVRFGGGRSIERRFPSLNGWMDAVTFAFATAVTISG